MNKYIAHNNILKSILQFVWVSENVVWGKMKMNYNYKNTREYNNNNMYYILSFFVVVVQWL